MEHEDSKSVNEQSHMDMTIKTEVKAAATSSAHIDIEMDFNHLKQEPGLLRPMKSEPALLVKEEILEDGSQDNNEQQCGKGTLMSSDAGSGNAACGTNVDVLLPSKQELEDIDIEPTVLQHMDIHYTMNQNMSAVIGENAIVDDCNEAMPDSGVKKEIAKNKLIGSFTPQKVELNERCSTLQNPQLAVHRDRLESISRVHLMRLDTFQCELCNAAYTEKRWLLQHLKSVHGSSLPTSLFVKSRKANKHQSAADNQIKAGKGQTNMRINYNKVHLTSCLGQPKELQQCHHRASSSNGFKCVSCDRTFRKPHLLSAHKKLHARQSKTSVTTSSTVAGPSNLSRDAKAKQKRFKCDICVKGCSSKSSLNTHKHFGLSVYHIHDAKFNKKNHMTDHLLTHTGEKPYQCTTCDSRFADRGTLTKHMRVHTGEKPYPCTTCDAKFAEGGALTKHMRVHTGEKPYQCTTCDVRFARSDALIQHMRVHTGEKPYKCTTCDVRFATRSTLTTHMRVHTGEKPYECTTCDARFAHSGVLTKHMRVHTGEKPYHCTTCEARFARRDALISHMRVHTGKKHKSSHRRKAHDISHGRKPLPV